MLFNALISQAAFAGVDPADFATRFADPPAQARILKIIHSWPDQGEAQDQLIRKLCSQGFGGVVCNVGFDHYLENENKWEAFVRAVSQAKKAGMALWLYDERGYPSGNAGGITLRGHPEWEARGLLIADTQTAGGALTLSLPPGQPVLVEAFPKRNGRLQLEAGIDLSDRVREGKLAWQAPEGSWQVLAVTEDRLFEGTHAAGNLWSKMPYVNLLLPEPTARFIEATHGAYAERLGSDLGRYFMGTFTDEPSLMSLFLSPMPHRVLPWSSNLAAEFRKRRGYVLETRMLPALVAEAGPETSRWRYDYWLTIGELVSENFFGQVQTWCRKHQVPSGGHLLLEENLAAQVSLYGDFFRCIRRLDAPSIDCLTSVPAEVPWYIARALASAGELEGRSIVMCETSDHGQVWRPAGDKRPKRVVSEAEIRGTCNRLIVSGVNCITSYYSFTDVTDEQLRRLNTWIGRCCTAVTGGHQVADVALVYPVESLWTRFIPSRHWTREAAGASAVENLYRGAAESLFAARRDFTVVDSRALAEARADGGTLTHGKLRWRAVVLPGVDTLPLAAWENLARFVRDGGIIIALGALPVNSERDFPSPQVAALSREMFGAGGREPFSQTNVAGGAGLFLPAGSESFLPLALDGALEPDVQTEERRSPLRITHRRIDGVEVYFVVNDSPRSCSESIRFAAQGNGERWDITTGRMAEQKEGATTRLNLEPYGAAIFRFAKAGTPRRRPVQGGLLPNLSLNLLPQANPTAPHGEFVRAEIRPDSLRSRPDHPAWETVGTLTRSQVDTFLFAQFHYEPGLDLTGADCLAVETWVPEGQQTANQLLIILHEQEGGDFMASTARSLAAPGRERSLVPWSQFQLAGWSKDSDGALDLKRISDVRIGWGGYLGAEGEKVVFSLALPQAGSVRTKTP